MSAPSEADVRRAVLDAVAEILPDVPGTDVTDGRSLADLGADSVDRVEILSLITHRLRRSDPVSVFADIPDIGALVDFLSGGVR